jgi:hypothetical protein
MASRKSSIDPGVKRWATETQSRYIDAVNEHGSIRAAARALDVAYFSVQRAVTAAEHNAAVKSPSQHRYNERDVPDAFVIKGISQYVNKEGLVAGQWIKSQLDGEKWEAAKQAALAALAEELPRVKPRPFKGHSLAHLVTIYTLTDSHVGMLAWGKEGGHDWDLKIAENVLVGCFEQMIAAAPNSHVGFLNQLGDFLHFDGLKAITPEHGHLLDADGRFEKIVEVAVRILRRVVELMLGKHEKLIVLAAEGNHDPAASVWLRTLLAAIYENEPRITVMRSALPYYVYEHGRTLLAFHHGHLKKPDQLPIMIAAQFPAQWGATTKRYCHTGHRHHVEEKEHSGITVIQHPTLAARDAYAARGGWIAERQVTAITYHDRHGRVRTDTVVPEMIEEEAACVPAPSSSPPSSPPPSWQAAPPRQPRATSRAA